jgi:hypothetical protein
MGKILKMTLDQLRTSVKESVPPTELPPLLAALWWDAKGDWNRAHEIAQAEADRGTRPDAAWVHAYLHRKEGDTWNANYWYRRASQLHPDIPLDEEWAQIASALLAHPLANRSR